MEKEDKSRPSSARMFEEVARKFEKRMKEVRHLDFVSVCLVSYG